MDIEFDHRTYSIDVYYDLSDKKYFKLSEGLIFRMSLMEHYRIKKR